MPVESTEVAVVSYADITNLRGPRYRLSADLKVKSHGEAVRFINDAGIVLLFPGDNLPLPDLWSAINGYERKLPRHHHDWALSKAWDWKDQIPARKEAWYGKIIRGKPAFIASRDLPAVYALSPNYGELDDYLEAYADGLMSKEAKDIYEILLREGPLPTSALRKASGLQGGGEAARRFERAIAELQTGLKIAKAGISDTNRWKYCYVYDLLLRWSPKLGEEARRYNSRTAMRHLIERYLQSSIAAPVRVLAWLFGWDAGITELIVAEMLAEGALRPIRVTGEQGAMPRAKRLAQGEVWVTNREWQHQGR